MVLSKPQPWVSADDAILAIDLAADGTAGADGKITQSREFMFTEWSATAETDLQGLSDAFDTNFDGVFDARDARWSEFRIWRDANSDGESQEGELIDLDTAGITSLNLSAEGDKITLPDGSIVHGIGEYTRSLTARRAAMVTLNFIILARVIKLLKTKMAVILNLKRARSTATSWLSMQLRALVSTLPTTDMLAAKALSLTISSSPTANKASR